MKKKTWKKNAFKQINAAVTVASLVPPGHRNRMAESRRTVGHNLASPHPAEDHPVQGRKSSMPTLPACHAAGSNTPCAPQDTPEPGVSVRQARFLQRQVWYTYIQIHILVTFDNYRLGYLLNPSPKPTEREKRRREPIQRTHTVKLSCAPATRSDRTKIENAGTFVVDSLPGPGNGSSASTAKRAPAASSH